jgi:hypothetical protein
MFEDEVPTKPLVDPYIAAKQLVDQDQIAATSEAKRTLWKQLTRMFKQTEQK